MCKKDLTYIVDIIPVLVKLANELVNWLVHRL